MMATKPLTDRERQDLLLTELHKRGRLTHNQAWEFGHQIGFYIGADGGTTLMDLTALVRRNKACRKDGFWRHIGEPDREKYTGSWSDYWTPKGGSN